MQANVEITGAIVIYKSDKAWLERAIESFLQIPIPKKLFLIYNSPNENCKPELQRPDIEYIFNGSNMGFGAAHNSIISRIKGFSKYHLVFNPDVEFNPAIIIPLIKELEKDKTLALIAPKVKYPDGDFQASCRRYPSFFELIIRRVRFLKEVFQNRIGKGEYIDIDFTKPFYPDFIHGCFHLYKTDDFVTLGGFDERYFLYIEDVDICKQIDKMGKKKMYFPGVSIVHALNRGSSINFKLFLLHLHSAFKYFNKWGWFKNR